MEWLDLRKIGALYQYLPCLAVIIPFAAPGDEEAAEKSFFKL